jgi:hypothetical protein
MQPRATQLHSSLSARHATPPATSGWSTAALPVYRPPRLLSRNETAPLLCPLSFSSLHFSSPYSKWGFNGAPLPATISPPPAPIPPHHPSTSWWGPPYIAFLPRSLAVMNGSLDCLLGPTPVSSLAAAGGRPTMDHSVSWSTDHRLSLCLFRIQKQIMVHIP